VRPTNLAAAAVLVARAAAADSVALAPSADPAADEQPTRPGRMLVEETSFMALMSMWYFTHPAASSEDFDLQWDWPSWRDKLTSLKDLRFDTNRFDTNAVGHPIAGFLEYQAARSNGFGPIGSTLIDFAGAVFWEYVIEYREYPSINDIVVNTACGIGLGEPLREIGVALGRDHSVAHRAMGWVFAPFDSLHGLMDPPRAAPVRSTWLRTRLWSGLSEAWVPDGGGRTETSVGLDLELVTQPSYGEPGAGSGWSRTGAWSRLDARLDLAGEGMVGVRVSTRTSLFGQYARDIADTPEGPTGWGRFIGAASGFELDVRQLGVDRDQIASLHLFGPQLSLDAHLGAATLRWELLGYFDLAMVHANVFGPVSPFIPTPHPTSALRSHGYYYGYGATVGSRVRLEQHGWIAELDGRAQQYHSIDGLDRIEITGPEAPRNVEDRRVYGHLELSAPFGHTGWGATLSGDLILRQGNWTTEDRTTVEKRIGASVGLSP
jgi:hypothetical protein